LVKSFCGRWWDDFFVSSEFLRSNCVFIIITCTFRNMNSHHHRGRRWS
jgi:hypothetical protein